MNRLQNLRRSLSNKVVQPDYAGLTNVVFHGRYEGLVNNTNNTYGIVDVSGNVTKWKSVSPHATGVEFDSNGTAPTLAIDGLTFGGAGRLRHATAATFNNFHYRATLNDLKWTIHGVIKFGTSSDPNAVYGLCGNNGSASTSKGIAIYYDDRASVPVNNSLGIMITKGTTSSYLTLASNTNIITPNQYLDIWIQCDKSLDQEDEIKVYINGFRFVVSNRIDTVVPVTTPTYVMEIGGTGNGGATATIAIKELTFMDGVMSDAFRQNFITARMYKYGLAAFPNVIDSIPISSDWVLLNTFDENRYYLTNHLCQSPLDSNKIVSIFTDGTNHLPTDGKVISRRISTDKGITWSSKTLVYDQGGTDCIQDIGAGYGSDGRLHVITDALHTAAGPTWTSFGLFYMYSDDDGATWSSAVDITSVIPSDGLAAWRVYSSLIENNGVLMCAYYKTTSEVSGANSARYILRSTDNGATWTSILIQSGATHRNETTIIGLSTTVVLAVTRDESTLEYYQSISTDNGLTWTNQGDLSFGESFARATPVRLKKFQIDSTDVIACYYSDRDRDIFKVIYALPADLISSGLTGWNIGTKLTLHQGSNNEHLHYGDVCHYNGGFEAISQSAIDQYPNIGTGTENEMYTIKLPTFHYPLVKSALGL
jgi:hypothetical protein